MKIDEKKKLKKAKKNAKPIPKAKVLIVAQELKFARLLAGNEKKSRDRVLKSLKKWLGNCFEKGYEFKEEDFVRVWKGLFYAVWMSDKPLIQEELCDSIAAILEQFPAEQYRHALLMYRAGLRVLATEWYGLDQHRMDKFLMLVRRLLRASLRCVASQEWSEAACEQYSEALTEDCVLSATTPNFARNALSLMLHICDCFLEELSKVSKGALPEASVAALLGPFVGYVCCGQEQRGAVAARRLLTRLLRQSTAGVEYEERRRAWERMGCPEGGPDALEMVSEDEDDAENGEHAGSDGSETEDADGDESADLDPRAGRGDVILHSLPVPARELAKRLRVRLRTAKGKQHARAKICLQRFEQFAASHYPLRVPQTPPARHEPPPRARAAARRLQRLDRKLRHDPGRAAMRGLSRKHRKRLLARAREGSSIVEELRTLRPKAQAQTNGKWHVEDTKPAKAASEDASDKETPTKNGKKSKKRKPSTETDDNSPSKKRKTAEDTPKALVNGKEKKFKAKTKDGSPKTTRSESKTTVPTKQLKKNKVDIAVNEKKSKPDKAKVKEQLKQAKKEQKTTVAVSKVKNFQKQTTPDKIEKKTEKKSKKTEEKSSSKTDSSYDTPKKLKFALKNNSMQSTMDYYKSVRQSPNIPFDGKKQPSKTNLKANSTPSPINPFFKKKLRMKT